MIKSLCQYWWRGNTPQLCIATTEAAATIKRLSDFPPFSPAAARAKSSVKGCCTNYGMIAADWCCLYDRSEKSTRWVNVYGWPRGADNRHNDTIIIEARPSLALCQFVKNDYCPLAFEHFFFFFFPFSFCCCCCYYYCCCCCCCCWLSKPVTMPYPMKTSNA